MIKTLSNKAARFRLRDSSISNEDLARHLRVEHRDAELRHHHSFLFLRNGRLAAIRVSASEVAVLYPFETVRNQMAEIGDKIEGS